jgi:hypothetical protein
MRIIFLSRSRKAMQLRLRRLLMFNIKGIVSRDLQSLTTQWRKIRKILHKNEILKAN